MIDSLANRSREELLHVGEAICRGRDWRWVAIWAYNIHKLFRGAMQRRDVWDELDGLIRRECDWHLGRDLIHAIRQVTLGAEKGAPDAAEYAYLLLGEITAKSISNASWSPGLFDFNAPWEVPALSFEICKQRQSERQAEFLHYHFMSLSERYAGKLSPER